MSQIESEFRPHIVYDFDMYNDSIYHIPWSSPLFRDPERCAQERLCSQKIPGQLRCNIHEFKAYQMVFGMHLTPMPYVYLETMASDLRDTYECFDKLTPEQREEWRHGVAGLLEFLHHSTRIKIEKEEGLRHQFPVPTMGWGDLTTISTAADIELKDLEKLSCSHLLPRQDLPGLCVTETFSEPIVFPGGKQFAAVISMGLTIPRKQSIFTFTDGTTAHIHAFRFLALRGVAGFRKEA